VLLRLTPPKSTFFAPCGTWDAPPRVCDCRVAYQTFDGYEEVVFYYRVSPHSDEERSMVEPRPITQPEVPEPLDTYYKSWGY
jgi:hypothetical protein